MATHTVFCSATDRDVALVARTPDLAAAMARGEVACLENGVRCTGASCPYCAGRPSPAPAGAGEHPAPEA
jgi:hypothetical protein